MSDQPLFIALGAHVLDVHAKYVETIPEGQGGALIEEIRVSPAGAAGGTAITLAKLGARTVSVGAIGTDDLGDVLVTMLQRLGVENRPPGAQGRSADVGHRASHPPQRRPPGAARDRCERELHA